MFREISLEELVDVDPDGRVTKIHPLRSGDLSGFNPRDPEHVAKLNQIFDAYTGRDPIDARQATSKWLDRFNITADDPRYAAEFDRLIEKGASNQAVIAESRRAGERAELMVMTGGNLSVNCMYVNEGADSRVCDECYALGGTEGPLSMFEEQNIMPGDRCLGNDSCRCQLIPIDNV
jgi:hypothetical protein